MRFVGYFALIFESGRPLIIFTVHLPSFIPFLNRNNHNTKENLEVMHSWLRFAALLTTVLCEGQAATVPRVDDEVNKCLQVRGCLLILADDPRQVSVT